MTTWRALCVGGPSAGEVMEVDRWTFVAEEQPPISAREDPPAWIEAPREVVYSVRELWPGMHDEDRRAALIAAPMGFDVPESMRSTLAVIARREGCVGRNVPLSAGQALGLSVREMLALFDQG